MRPAGRASCAEGGHFVACLPVSVGLITGSGLWPGFYLRRKIRFGSLEPVATSVRPAAAAQMMDAAAMVTASLGWVETGGRKRVAAAVAA